MEKVQKNRLREAREILVEGLDMIPESIVLDEDLEQVDDQLVRNRLRAKRKR